LSGRLAALILYCIEELELLRDIHAAETEIAQGRDVPHDEARRQALEALRKA
jgi:hypothetical protein